MMEQNIPNLEAAEQRVLGSLMEKSRTTPDHYPMTLNSLAAACNQKTSRYPIVQYDEELIIQTLDSLKRKGLISTATGGSSRVVKFKHNFAIVYPLVPSELTIICLLLLRGPLTPGELNTNSARLYEFETLDEVTEVLQKLSLPEMAFVKAMIRRPGQKEVRYVHLLGDAPDKSLEASPEMPSIANTAQLEERVAKLEDQLNELRAEFDKLMKELN
ncbi:YceH family protein [Daejeonella sp.]|uniref:YceH family protein n=1 Tax=Daejeonella sp. TaxID=2805397 RepID=UPI0030C41098